MTREHVLGQVRARAPQLESIAALTASILAAGLATRKLLRPELVDSDALVHQYWMRSFQDAQLFRDDLTSMLLESERYPDGYMLLFRLLGSLADPIAVGEYLGIVLMAVSGWLVFQIVRAHTSWRPAAWLAAGLFLAVSDIHRFHGGFPRGFVHPAVLLAVLLAIRDRQLAAALVAAGTALFYPPAALLAVGILLLGALKWRGFRPGMDTRRLSFAILALVAMVLMVLGPQIVSGSVPDTMSVREARSYPEFGPDGPLPFFASSSLDYLRQNRSGFDLRASGSLLVVVAFFLLVVRPANLRLFRREVLSLPIVAIGAYVLAQLVLFKLYLPHRYTYPIIPFCVIVVGVTLRPTWEAVWSSRRSRLRAVAVSAAPPAVYYFSLYVFPLGPTRSVEDLSAMAFAAVSVALLLMFAAVLLLRRIPTARRASVAAGLTGLTLVGVLLSLPHRQPGGRSCPDSPATRYLETLPKDALIAGDPIDMDCIPVTARRPVVISLKLVGSYEAAYFQRSRARMFETLEAYYGSSPDHIVDLHVRYAASHLLVRRKAVKEEASRKGKRWKRKGRKRPYGEYVRHLMHSGRPAVLNLPVKCRGWNHGSEEIYEISCIAATRSRQRR